MIRSRRSRIASRFDPGAIMLVLGFFLACADLPSAQTAMVKSGSSTATPGIGAEPSWLLAFQPGNLDFRQAVTQSLDAPGVDAVLQAKVGVLFSLEEDEPAAGLRRTLQRALNRLDGRT